MTSNVWMPSDFHKAERWFGVLFFGLIVAALGLELYDAVAHRQGSVAKPARPVVVQHSEPERTAPANADAVITIPYKPSATGRRHRKQESLPPSQPDEPVSSYDETIPLSKARRESTDATKTVQDSSTPAGPAVNQPPAPVVDESVPVEEPDPDLEPPKKPKVVVRVIHKLLDKVKRVFHRHRAKDTAPKALFRLSARFMNRAVR